MRGDVESTCELVEGEGCHSCDEAPRNVLIAGGLELGEELGIHVLHPLERISASFFGDLQRRNKGWVAKSLVDAHIVLVNGHEKLFCVKD